MRFSTLTNFPIMQLQGFKVSLVLSVVIFTLGASACSKRGQFCGLFSSCCDEAMSCWPTWMIGMTVSSIHYNFTEGCWDAENDYVSQVCACREVGEACGLFHPKCCKGSFCPGSSEPVSGVWRYVFYLCPGSEINVCHCSQTCMEYPYIANDVQAVSDSESAQQPLEG